MSRRQTCQRCEYPVSVCICSAIKPFTPVAKLIILQHPSETRHAKNTARLIKLCCPDVQLLVGEDPEDFARLQQEVAQNPEQFALIYPNQFSRPLTKQSGKNAPLNFRHLIFIDGTWRKAFKIWKLNPWLQHLTSLHFEPDSPGQYQIRKAPGDFQLSTLEAAARTLEQGYQQDAGPLIDLFQTWQRVSFARHASFNS